MIRIISEIADKIRLDKDSSEILKGGVTTFVLKLSGFLFSFIYYLILGRFYGAEIVGIAALSIAIVMIFFDLGTIGTNISSVRFIAKAASYKKTGEILQIYNKILAIVLPVSIFLGVVVFLSAPFLAHGVFRKPVLVLPLRIMALCIPFAVFNRVNSASLRGLKKIRDSYIFTTVFTPFVNTIGLSILTLLAIRNYLTPIYANLISAILCGMISYVVWIKRLRPLNSKGTGPGNSIAFREILSTSFPMFVTSITILLLGWMDIIMLGIYKTSSEVGIYRVAMKMAVLSGLTLSAAISIAAPKFAELYASKKNLQLKKSVNFCSALVFWSSLPIIIFLVMLARHIMGLFGSQFTAGNTALIILIAGQFVNVACGPVGILLNMTEYQKTLKNIVLTAAVLNLALNAVLIPRYGIEGAATATSLSMIFWNFATSLFAYRKFGFWVGFLPGFLKRKVA